MNRPTAIVAALCVLALTITSQGASAAEQPTPAPQASATPPVAESDDTAGAKAAAEQQPAEVFQAPAAAAVPAALDDPCPVGPDLQPYAQQPPLLDAWFNTTDIEERGIVDSNDNSPWKFSQRFAQLLCGAAPNSTIKIGMYFLRATNGANQGEIDRPESDPEVVYAALEWVAKYRGAKISIILDNTNTCSQAIENSSCSHIMTPSARASLEKRFSTIPNSKIVYCVNGCFNTARYGVYPFAIEHEKFFAISDTDFPNQPTGVHPLVISSSVNIARSQIRNYHQEASSIYDDQKAFAEFNNRFDGMYSCATDRCRLLGNAAAQTVGTGMSTNPLGLVQEPGRKIWVDPVLYRDTDAGRGTRITFSPQRDLPDTDVFIHQFDDVDCDVDSKIRLAMFKLTDGKAQQMADTLKDLKNRGCDVKMLMTSEAGATIISSSVRDTLSAAGVDYKCAVDGMHTKLILIGPASGNLGSVLTGTMNMSVAGQLYNEEHVVTFDARKATGATRTAIRAVYDDYQHEWFELSRGASKSNCGAK